MSDVTGEEEVEGEGEKCEVVGVEGNEGVESGGVGVGDGERVKVENGGVVVDGGRVMGVGEEEEEEEEEEGDGGVENDSGVKVGDKEGVEGQNKDAREINEDGERVMVNSRDINNSEEVNGKDREGVEGQGEGLGGVENGEEGGVSLTNSGAVPQAEAGDVQLKRNGLENSNGTGVEAITEGSGVGGDGMSRAVDEEGSQTVGSSERHRLAGGGGALVSREASGYRRREEEDSGPR